MKVTQVESKTRKTYTVKIEDGEVVECKWARTDRRFRVQRVTVVKEDGNVNSVSIAGPVLKKDGTDSRNWADERLYGEKEWPTWLTPIIRGLA